MTTTAPAAAPAPLRTDPAALAARVVVGMDPSPASLAALRFAATEAAYRGGDVLAIHVYCIPTIWGIYPMWPDDPNPFGHVDAAMRATVGVVLAERAAAGEPLVEIGTVMVQGEHADELRRAAQGTAMLVLGARHHSRILGSVSSSVLSHSSHGPACPVVVVPAVPDDPA